MKAERLGAIGEIVDAARIRPAGKDHFPAGEKDSEFRLKIFHEIEFIPLTLSKAFGKIS
jgi:hypothetical protein